MRVVLALAAGVLALAAAGYAAAGCVLGETGEYPITMQGLHPLSPLQVNGRDGVFILDSGAVYSFVRPRSAEAFGMAVTDPPFFAPSVKGVTGEMSARVSAARNLALNGKTIRNARFLVLDIPLGGGVDGAIGRNLLTGMADVEFDLADGQVRLFNVSGCGAAPLAYWNRGGTWSEAEIEPMEAGGSAIVVPVKVNGAPMRALINSGTADSMITTSGAARAGVRTSDPRVTASEAISGITGRWTPTWIAPIAQFEIGQETIQNTHLRVAKIDLGSGVDVVLGDDFLLAHRLYVSLGRGAIYFTYNGGPVFNLTHSDAPPTASSPTAGDVDPAPANANDFERRGSARLSRHDYDGAVADFTQAIVLEPAVGQHYLSRALARSAEGRPALVAADLDMAIRLDPTDGAALFARGEARLDAGDAGAAKADFDAAAARDPEFLGEVAEAYLKHDRFEPAIAAFDGWIAARGKSPPALAYQGRCRARGLWNHDLDAALADCDRALALAPGDPGSLDSRGLVRLRLGQADKAVADCNEALKLNPQRAWTLYVRGLAKQAMGQTGAGDADIAAALAIDPKIADLAKERDVGPS